jgi:peptidoglycan/xylan/chitin deacetylase (PgdA/CDA1 family)
MSYLNHVVTTKGLMHSFERSAQILKRFLLGRRKFLQMITFLQNNFNGDTKITFCVTACLLAENSFLFKKLQQIGHDVAAHGYIHTNMKHKSKKEQIEIIRRCSRVFDEFSMPISGFRCPYLSYNMDTLDVLQQGGFAWTSNNMVLWRNGFSSGNGYHKSLKKINNLYTIEYAENHAVLPRIRDRCVDIPITGPDDEMLLERFRVKEKKKIAGIWLEILRQTHERGELFHLLFHPERFGQIRDCIKEIVMKAREFDHPIWFASLKEITDWWKQRKGFRWEHEQTSGGRWRTWVSLPSRATVLMKLPKGSTAGEGTFYGDYIRLDPEGPRSDNGRLFACVEGRKSSIGISPRCSRDIETFLKEEGFLAEYTMNPEDHPVFIDGYPFFSKKDEADVLRRVEESTVPLPRLWRWPDGAKSAFTISADVDSVTLMDFVRRAIKF